MSGNRHSYRLKPLLHQGFIDCTQVRRPKNGPRSHGETVLFFCQGELPFEGKATEHLIGEGIQPEHLNDDRLGRVLDKLYLSGLSQIFATIKNQLGRLTERPTLRWIFQCFQAVHLLQVDSVKQVSNLTDERLRTLSFFPATCQAYYLIH